jgi:alkyl sulfatase BDS1-like metallo-beta-lactamase superfamily hydrolase
MASETVLPEPKGAQTVRRLDLHDRAWTIRTEDGHVHVQAGEPNEPHASLHTDPKTLNDLLEDPGKLDAAVADGSAAIAGDRSALRRLLNSVAAPRSHNQPVTRARA